MFMMMGTSTTTTPTPSPENIRNIETTTSTFPTWKLYENPSYNSQKLHQNPLPRQQNQQQQQCRNFSTKQQEVHHCLHLPISARKLAASFWDLTFCKPASEMDYTRAQITEMKAKLKYERKARKKVESSNKMLAKELGEERRLREAIERVCEELAREISFGKSEIVRIRKEIEEERRMLRMVEMLREERLQMKLTEARLLFEEKVLELEGCKQMLSAAENSHFKIKHKSEDANVASFNNSSKKSGAFSGDRNNDSVSSFSTATSREVLLGEKAAFSENSGGFSSMAVQKRSSPEPENPHIKRGIKGFVEFPRVVRAIGSKSRHWGTKLECQKAQLRILMKQKSPIRSNSFIIS